MTRKQAVNFIEAVNIADELYSCVHGHVNCSTSQHGPCYDETMYEFFDNDNAETRQVVAA